MQWAFRALHLFPERHSDLWGLKAPLYLLNWNQRAVDIWPYQDRKTCLDSHLLVRADVPMHAPYFTYRCINFDSSVMMTSWRYKLYLISFLSFIGCICPCFLAPGVRAGVCLSLGQVVIHRARAGVLSACALEHWAEEVAQKNLIDTSSFKLMHV